MKHPPIPAKVNQKLERALRPHNDAIIAALVNLVIAVAFIGLPESILSFPAWLPLLCVVVCESFLLVTHYRSRYDLNQRVGFGLLMIQFCFLSLVVGSLVWGLPHNRALGGEAMLQTGARLWLANILVFTTWYWRFDGGGPHVRGKEECEHTSFLFPQMSMTDAERSLVHQSAWHPGVIDYLFLAFNTSTALSPADTAVIGRAAKLTTMVQALISLSIVVVVVGRSVNVM
jgi:hypothetical protein